MKRSECQHQDRDRGSSSTNPEPPSADSEPLPHETIDPSAIPEHWAFPLNPEPPKSVPANSHPPLEGGFPCVYNVISWRKCRASAKHKGICVTFQEDFCSNYSPYESPHACCGDHAIYIIVEERQGFCYGPYCPGFRELNGRPRPVADPPYRFNTQFYLGEPIEERWEGITWED
ncbi:hypothetical protein MFRU_010g02920 [Monilinia fructicola]|nr:hypothetical protein MFRU_010g02920 [Monilinia fructicola]